MEAAVGISDHAGPSPVGPQEGLATERAVAQGSHRVRPLNLVTVGP